MKKSILFASALFICASSFAQKGKVTSASNYRAAGNLDKALEAIQLAVDPQNPKSEKSINWPKTWEVRGEILQDIAKSDNADLKSKVGDDALKEAYDSYMKALELDKDGKYTKDLKIKLTFFINELQNGGVKAYNDKNYLEAAKYFGAITTIQAMDIFKDDKSTVDTSMIYNAALASQLGKDYENAIKYYKVAESMGYKGPDCYNQIIFALKSQGDTLAAVDAMKEAFEKYPDNEGALVELINYYIESGDSEGAFKYLDLAIEKDPSNVRYLFAKGVTYDQIGDLENAKKIYKQAIEEHPDFSDAYYNLGVDYYNDGVKLANEANKVPTSESAKYDALKSKSDDAFKEAIPYLEKASDLNDNDSNILGVLKNLYYRLNMKDKLNSVKEKLGE